MDTRILYIHGFNSSPGSMKALLTKDYIEKYHSSIHFHCPQIASSPLAAIGQLEKILNQYPNDQWWLMGSSLGGYFATYLSEQYQLPAALINPAIKPFELLSDYIGEQVNPYTQEVYRVTPEHMTQLEQLLREEIQQKNYQVMVQMGDEVLDYRQAVEKYPQSQLIVQKGGDHSFVNFEQMLPDIVKFFQLT